MQYASLCIENEHILLAILDKSKAQAVRILGEGTSVALLRREIEKNLAIHASISGPVDIPLTSESKQILSPAFEEPDELGNKEVACEHLLLRILQCETCEAARILSMHGAKLATDLQREAAESFVKDWNELLAAIASKSAAFKAAGKGLAFSLERTPEHSGNGECEDRCLPDCQPKVCLLDG